MASVRLSHAITVADGEQFRRVFVEAAANEDNLLLHEPVAMRGAQLLQRRQPDV